ncbi:hypothetical protein HDZ31DRAFT_76980 [Schizophyllum fasciatum]
MSLPTAERPDPFAREGLPADQDLNPHLRFTQRGEPPFTPNPGYARITESRGRHVVIPSYRLLGNSSKTQIAVALAEPDKFLLLIPFGAGRSFHTKVPNFGDLVRNLLRSFLFEDQTEPDDIVVTRIFTANNREPRAGQSTHFNQPWGYLLQCGERLHRWLRWKERISAEINLTFSVYPLDSFEDSWKIAVLSGDVVSADTSGARRWEILGFLKKACWADKKLRRHVIDVARKQKLVATPDQLMADATRTWDLTATEHKDGLGRITRVYVLTGRPITNDDMDRQLYVGLINEVDAWVGVQRIDLRAFRDKISCTWCKSELHCAHACDSGKVEGDDWYGPDPAVDNPEPQAEGGRLDMAAVHEEEVTQEDIWGPASQDWDAGRGRGCKGTSRKWPSGDDSGDEANV